MLRIFRRPWDLRVKLVASLTVVNLVGTSLFAVLSYRAAQERSLADIDETLCTAAEGAKQFVPDIVINESEQKARTEPQFTAAYRQAFGDLTTYAKNARLKFIWTIVVRPDGSAYELVSNLSADQIAANADPIQVLLQNPYELPPVYLEAASTGEQRTGSADDNYGSFRSCILPMKAATGNVVLFGADMNITDVADRLRQNMIGIVANGLIALAVTLAVAMFIAGTISREIRDVVEDANAVSQLRLGQPGPRRMSRTLEVEMLFHALDDMKKGLRAFTKYVPAAVIGRVLETGKAEIGGERRELSLLMTDVANFTTISEQLEPERVMVAMSEYFDRVVGALLDEKATVDKYVGDAIFAYWNAPALQADHAARACRAALRARKASQMLAREWQALDQWPWQTRFGVHSGPTVFGNVGAPDRMDFTVIGSPVNLASRLEGLNKFYGTEILVSGRSRELAGQGFLFRPVDVVMAKGAFEPMAIHELIASAEIEEFAPVSDDILFVEKWNAAYALYRRREFQAASSAFTALAQARPNDPVAKLYVKRTAEYATAPPPVDWDGVQHFETK